jgi:hypothetical protein
VPTTPYSPGGGIDIPQQTGAHQASSAVAAVKEAGLVAGLMARDAAATRTEAREQLEKAAAGVRPQLSDSLDACPPFCVSECLTGSWWHSMGTNESVEA